jgi:4-amino-4-deoxy-L-arabinose transferase-like glycosyltransferase
MAAILIALAITGMYMFAATRSTLWDRDETYYARVAVEMVESGNYLVPTFNDEPWLEKPVLLYWLMSVPIRLFGPTEYACRFFSAIGTGLTCLLTFVLARKLVDARAALWAMVILCSTSMVLRVGGSATSDPVVLPFMVGALAVFVYALDAPTGAPHIILMGIALGLGVLAKGPVGLLPIPVIVAWLWLCRRTKPISWRAIWPIGAALAVASLIALAWAVPANVATKGEFYRVFVEEHVIDRMLRPMQGHGHRFWVSLPYYFPVVILDLFPWTLYLPGTISAVLGSRVGGRRGRAVLLGWTVPIFVLVSLAATKLPHYLLFIWPALAVAVAGTIVAAQKGTLNARDRIWLRRGVWLFGPLAAVGALVLAVGPWFLYVPGLRWPGLACGAGGAAMAAIAIRYQRADRPMASAKILLAGMFVFQIPLLLGVLPAIEQMKLAPRLAQAVNKTTAREVPVAACGYLEPSLHFYFARHIEYLLAEEEVVTWAQRPQPGILVIPRHTLDGIEEKYGDLPLEQIAATEGVNYSKGTMLELLALTRKAD